MFYFPLNNFLILSLIDFFCWISPPLLIPLKLCFLSILFFIAFSIFFLSILKNCPVFKNSKILSSILVSLTLLYDFKSLITFFLSLISILGNWITSFISLDSFFALVIALIKLFFSTCVLHLNLYSSTLPLEFCFKENLYGSAFELTIVIFSKDILFLGLVDACSSNQYNPQFLIW